MDLHISSLCCQGSAVLPFSDHSIFSNKNDFIKQFKQFMFSRAAEPMSGNVGTYFADTACAKQAGSASRQGFVLPGSWSPQTLDWPFKPRQQPVSIIMPHLFSLFVNQHSAMGATECCPWVADRHSEIGKVWSSQGNAKPTPQAAYFSSL